MPRIDQLLVQRGLAPSRSAAQRLIEHGAVCWRMAPDQPWQLPRKAGEALTEACELQVTDDAETRWVSRGGLKLESALACTGLDPAGLQALDVGQSTGGFSELLLARGAARVVGFDVGHGQLHPRLAGHPRLLALEGLHVRQLAGSALADAAPAGGFDLLVGDLSFIPMSRVLPDLAPWLRPGGQALLLIKPQFELGPEHVGRGGLVKDASCFPRLEQTVRAACAALAWTVRDYFPSALAGGDGNQEFFVWAVASPPEECLS
ncbi:TlyA family RNA methyltransferase [Piscinibacter sp. Jin2]|uniref:TlyA family RNA methyltransferase n=1 Tax=Aquariibacter lacus TaxID=2801332 RepID=A0A9X0XFY0_9BURK|nr:TlyA family RNA methyltransferase [Piscinibacter lacus]MBL0718820.1 TlyA family RNA methyltransferase [Piscinibacter lacus]